MWNLLIFKVLRYHERFICIKTSVSRGNKSIIDVKTNVSGDLLRAKLKNLLGTLPLHPIENLLKKAGEVT